MPKNQELRLRKAGPEDAPAILELVRELAVFEKAPEAVKTTESDYREGLNTGLFDVILTEHDQHGVVGMVLFFPYFSTWGGRTMYLEDFIVREPFRRSGIGRLLFDAFLNEARNQNAKKVKWQVLDWNEPAKAFYRKYQAELISGWENGTIEF